MGARKHQLALCRHCGRCGAKLWPHSQPSGGPQHGGIHPRKQCSPIDLVKDDTSTRRMLGAASISPRPAANSA